MAARPARSGTFGQFYTNPLETLIICDPYQRIGLRFGEDYAEALDATYEDADGRMPHDHPVTRAVEPPTVELGEVPSPFGPQVAIVVEHVPPPRRSRAPRRAGCEEGQLVLPGLSAAA